MLLGFEVSFVCLSDSRGGLILSYVGRMAFTSDSDFHFFLTRLTIVSWSGSGSYDAIFGVFSVVLTSRDIGGIFSDLFVFRW